MFQNETVPKSEESQVGNKADFRVFLLNELTQRCRANPAYSLRAFSRELGLESSHLSKILRGLRPIKAKLTREFGERLNLTQDQIEVFLKVAPARKGSKKAERTARYKQLSTDAFATIEDWRHYAILELMRVRGFQPDVKWVAQQLRIKPIEAHAYVERLQRVGLLEINAGVWIDKTEGYSSHVLTQSESTYAHKRAQEKILELSSDALRNVAFNKRDHSSMMMATNREKLIEAKRRIRDFRRELCDFLEDCEIKDSVYQISVSLFPLVETDTEEAG
jgi:uncharacterized protein (TIGR02147 family)